MAVKLWRRLRLAAAPDATDSAGAARPSAGVPSPCQCGHQGRGAPNETSSSQRCPDVVILPPCTICDNSRPEGARNASRPPGREAALRDGAASATNMTANAPGVLVPLFPTVMAMDRAARLAVV